MQLILRPPNTEVILREIAELCEYIPLALRLAGPLLAVDSEYTLNELKCELEKNPTSALGVKPIMEIAFEKLEEFFNVRWFIYQCFLSLLKETQRKQYLTNLKKSCLFQKQSDRYLIHLLIRSYTKQIGQRK